MQLKSDPPDCFAQLDAALAAISVDLETTRTALKRPAAPPPLQLVVTAPSDLPSVHETAEVEEQRHENPDNLDEYEEAFSRIDALMDGAGRGEVVSGHMVTTRVSQFGPAQAPENLPTFSESQLWRPRPDGGTPLERLLGTFENLSRLHGALGSARSRRDQRVSDDALVCVLAEARDVCGEFDLRSARVRAEFALEALAGRRSDLKTDIAELLRHIRRDAQSCTIGPTPVAAEPHRPPRSRAIRKHSAGSVQELREVAADAKQGAP